jgi:hypothetical protein
VRASGAKKQLAISLLNLGLLLPTGCVTRSLWEPTDFVPAKVPNICLYESEQPPDILVEFDERIAGGRPTARRAYFLHANADLALLQAPQFVEPAQATVNLKPVPFFKRGVSEEAWPTRGYFAVECYYRDGFLLYHDGRPEGAYKLPFYRKTTKSLGRAILTPGAVAVDAAFTAGAWAVIVGSQMGH